MKKGIIDPAPVLAGLKEVGAVVVTAPTGSGKSTQIPLALIREYEGQVIVTEPRRVAALSLAHFLAARLGQKVGHEVGFQVRFERWPGTRLTFMTPGVFLAHLRMRREIPGVDVVVVDEFHERDALTDAVLALLREQRRQGRLRVVVMSATLEASRVASYLDAIHIDFGASSIRENLEGEVLNNGRYEVHILYRPNADLPQILREISEKEEKKDPRFPGGGTLVFLPGKREIEEAARQVRAAWPEAVILPLHSECSEEEIRAALNPPQGRRWVVLATNVAETSLTIPDVRYVVDTGVEKVQVWDPRTGAGSLRPVPISRSSAAQRAGRAGRTGPGVVFRMWSREDHARRPEFRPPEILREDLGHLTLQLLDMGIRPSSLEWLDAPPKERWAAAEALLQRLGAVTPTGELTPVGKQMARLPLEPRLARAVVEAVRNGGEGMDLLLLVAAVASVDRLFLRGEEDAWRQGRQALAEIARKSGSDLFAMAEAIARFESDRRAANLLGLRRAVAEEALRIRDQLRDILRSAGVRWQSGSRAASNYEAARKALVSAFADGLRVRREGGFYAAVHEGMDGEILPVARLDRENPLASELPDILAAREVREIPTRRGVMYLITSAVVVRPRELLELLGPERVTLERSGPVYDPDRDRAGFHLRYRLDGRAIAEEWEDAAGLEAGRALAAALIRSPWSCGPRREAGERLQAAVSDFLALLARDPARKEEAPKIRQAVEEVLARRLAGITSMGEIPLEALEPSAVLQEALEEALGISLEAAEASIRSRFPDRMEVEGVLVNLEYGQDVLTVTIPTDGLARLRDETVRAAVAGIAGSRSVAFATPGIHGVARTIRDLRVALALREFPREIWRIPEELRRLPLAEPITILGPDGPEIAGYLGLTGRGSPWWPGLFSSPAEAEASVRAALAAQLRRETGATNPEQFLHGHALQELLQDEGWKAVRAAADAARAQRDGLLARVREIIAQVQRESWSWVGKDRVEGLILRAWSALENPALDAGQLAALEAELASMHHLVHERRALARQLDEMVGEIRELVYRLPVSIRRMWDLLHAAEKANQRLRSWSERDQEIQEALDAAAADIRAMAEEARAIAAWISQFSEMVRELACPVCGDPAPYRCEHPAGRVSQTGWKDLLHLPAGQEIPLIRVRAGGEDAAVLVARRAGDWVSFTQRRPEDFSEIVLRPLELQRTELTAPRPTDEGQKKSPGPARPPAEDFEEISDGDLHEALQKLAGHWGARVRKKK